MRSGFNTVSSIWQITQSKKCQKVLTVLKKSAMDQSLDLGYPNATPNRDYCFFRLTICFSPVFVPHQKKICWRALTK